ncbi:hypothetical protein [Stutzerimonas nitrititolerans]|uniref:hypothetical protein n=1 Tax=Stutzerimonas nitrititolerans TaxID=2482751 RepID=UPI0028A69309|nr:hypothetical protein [Stutzerimonas nitrititolerans]
MTHVKATSGWHLQRIETLASILEQLHTAYLAYIDDAPAQDLPAWRPRNLGTLAKREVHFKQRFPVPQTAA